MLSWLGLALFLVQGDRRGGWGVSVLTPCQGTDWHSLVRWEWDVTHPAVLTWQRVGANLGLEAASARFFYSLLRPAQGLVIELLLLGAGVCLALPGPRAGLGCQGCQDVPQLGKIPKGKPQGPSIAAGWKTANTGALKWVL